MIEVKEKSKINQAIYVSATPGDYELEKVNCQGCVNIKKPFWGESCPVKSCCENKGLNCCGECETFPCELLISFAYDEKQGDNGLRIENCKEWCNLNS